MNRRDFLKGSGLSALLAASMPSALAQRSSSQDAAAPLQFTTAPCLHCPTENAVSVSIGVNRPSTAWVEYGETEKLGNVVLGSVYGLKPFDAEAHRFHIEGLRPGRAYFYRVRGCAIGFGEEDRGQNPKRLGKEIQTPILSFQTLNSAASEARFSVINDTHNQTETLTKLAPLIREGSPDFVLWNGDVCNHLSAQKSIPSQYFAPANQPYFRETPMVFVRGNHDTRGALARKLPSFIDLPENRFYYSFRQGPMAAIVLDTGEDKSDDHVEYGGLSDFAPYLQQETAWLEAELCKPHIKNAPFRVLFCHIPLLPCGRRAAALLRHGNELYLKWARMIADAKFTAAISGHVHFSELIPPNQEHSFAQLTGGGPHPSIATVIRGRVTEKELSIAAFDLQNRELRRFSAKA